MLSAPFCCEHKANTGSLYCAGNDETVPCFGRDDDFIIDGDFIDGDFIDDDFIDDSVDDPRTARNSKNAVPREGLLVVVHPPAEVLAGGLVDGGGGVREVGGDVVLEAVLADEAEEILHLGDLDDAGAAEGVEGVVGEGALADVAADLAGEVVGGEAGEAHGAGFHRSI